MNPTEFSLLAVRISKLKPDDDAGFQAVLNEAMNKMNVLEGDLAREFGVSLSTVNRWSNGRSMPHPAVRKPILESLAKRARNLANRANAKTANSSIQENRDLA